MSQEIQYATSSSGMVAQPQRTPLLARLENSIGNLKDVSDQIGALANDICGAIPQEISGSEIPSGPNPGFAQTIEIAIELINMSANGIRNDTIRIRERILR